MFCSVHGQWFHAQDYLSNRIEVYGHVTHVNARHMTKLYGHDRIRMA